MNGNCVMDIRRMYIGSLNSKQTSSVSFSVTRLPSSLTFIVPGPSLEYNAAIFTECYPRIKIGIVFSACDLLADP